MTVPAPLARRDRRRFVALAMAAACAAVAGGLVPGDPHAGTSTSTAAPGFAFDALTGGRLSLDDWRGRPVLVVNTASLCGYTYQYDDMQVLYDRYRGRGLVVLAVPSNDFRQELASDEKVAEFCEVNFALDFPMTRITPVRGDGAHPFYRWLARDHGFVPNWNFNKVLIGPRGEVLGTWRSATQPTARPIRRAIEAALDG
jgi:glutathione peroxidase